MNTSRFFALFAISIVLAVTSFGFVSAASLTISQISFPTSVPTTQGTFDITFNVTNIGEGTNVTLTNTPSNGAYTITFLPSSPVQILTNQSSIITARLTFAQQTGPIAGMIIADPSGGGGTKNFTFSTSLTAVSSISLSKTQDFRLNQNGTFTITNIGQSNLGAVNFQVFPLGVASFNPSSLSLLNAGDSKSIILSILDAGKLLFGSNTVSVTATSGSNTATIDFPIEKTFCNSGPAGTNLSISSVTLRNTGDDDETWNPLDEISVKVDVDNNGLADMKEVYVKLGLFDNSGSNKIRSLDFLGTEDEEISIGTINDGGTEKAEFNFKVPVDLKEGGYKLAIKAFSKRSGESRDCADSVPTSDFDHGTYQTIDVEKHTSRGELIAITNFVAPDQNICGTTLAGSFDVANVGDVDQDKILVHMRTPGLGADQEFELVGGLDEGDDPQTFNFEIPLPTNIKDGSYSIFFSSRYDYENGAYGEVSKSESEERVKVIGCSGNTGSNGGTGQNTAITATLGSDAKAGEKLVVNAVVRNLGTTQQTFIIDANGYQSWSTLDSISDRIITLDAGQSKAITITLNIDKDATSPQEFTIESVSNGKTTSQIVDVKLAENTSKGFSFAGNGLIWVIGAINLILIILIIVVAVRVSRR